MFNVETPYTQTEKETIDCHADIKRYTMYDAYGKFVDSFTYNKGYITMWCDDIDDFVDMNFEEQSLETRLNNIVKRAHIKDLYDFETFKKCFSRLEADRVLTFLINSSYYIEEDVD
jgi:hypothetical protein